jgi:hypothetical protein
MYAVIYTHGFQTDLTANNVKPHIFKVYKKKETALKCAYTRNQMISQQVLGVTYFVYEKETQQVLRAERVN